MSQIASEQTVTGGETPPAVGGQPSQEVIGRSPWELFWRRFREDRAAKIGLVIIVILLVLAIAAPLFAKMTGHGPDELFIYETLDENGIPDGPNGEFWFGADGTSRDLFVRILYGARISLTVAFVATGIELAIGVALGLIAGFYRGKMDTLLSRIADVVYSLPVLLLALGLVAACGLSKEGCLGGVIKQGLGPVIMVISLFSWPYLFRIVRGQVFTLREKEFVEAARAMGSSNFRIMWREILPNVLAPIIVYTTLIIPTNILFESALSFLGLGVQPPTPSWGAMLEEASTAFTYAWWLLVFPGTFLVLTTLAFNLVGDGLRDAFDPRMA